MSNDMPPLVDADSRQRPSNHIPPPPGATILPPGAPPPPHHAAPPQNYPWGYPAGPSIPTYAHPNYASPQSQQFSPQYPYPSWYPYYGSPPYQQQQQQQSAPSPYVPHQQAPPETHRQGRPAAFHRGNNHPAPEQREASHLRNRATSLVRRPRSPHAQQAGELSPLFDNLETRPTIRDLGAYPTNLHTPSSTLSFPAAAAGGSSQPRPTMYNERPSNWRRDFRFKSGLAGVFHIKSSQSYPPNDWTSSSKLMLHRYLQHDKVYPPTIYDLRRDPQTLVFRSLDRRPDQRDMAQTVTDPRTPWMRIYNSRLPWYIDIVAQDGGYITLADLFQQLFAALQKPIHQSDYYNDDLDDHDRQALNQAYIGRCRDEVERMGGVRRVDFLRGKVFFEGLSKGKNGMWRLRTGMEKL